MLDLERINTLIFNIIFGVSFALIGVSVLAWSWIVFLIGLCGVIIAMVVHYIISAIDLINKEKRIN